ncbi:MAG: Ribonuclease HII [Chlamydiia bacterium]|nr:Ribonuclease HII [Chlamydiia bacterium]
MTQQQQEVPTSLFENQAYALGYEVVVGIDEAGRGPLAGPVVAAACYVPQGIEIEGALDSKQLEPSKRSQVFEYIKNHPDIMYATGIVDPSVIDSINILQASMQAMLLAVQNLPVDADYLLIDGNQFPRTSLPGLALVRGDQRSVSIALSSIIAKETRDDLMREYHKKWPLYGFDSHKGYATRDHIMAVKAYGATPIHRKSFEPIRSLTKN